MKKHDSLLKALLLFLLSASVGMAILILIIAPYVLAETHNNPTYLSFYLAYIAGLIFFVGTLEDK